MRFNSFSAPAMAYFIIMFGLNMILPGWTGEENSLIENLQMLWLIGGFYYCYKLTKEKLPDWGGCQKALWYGGMIFFFLVIMRELSWGRTFFVHPDGSIYKYSEMGLYGKLVHPTVGILIAAFLYLMYSAKVWKFFQLIKLPVVPLGQTLLFITAQWLAEHHRLSFFSGDVAEELAEFGAYMMLFYILCDCIKALKNASK